MNEATPFVRKTTSLQDVIAEIAERDRIHTARPWPYRKSIDTYRAVRRFRWSRLYYEPKWFIQRGRRGWADCDIWSLDCYLTTVLKTSIIRLRDTDHGHPQELTDHQWHAVLTQIATGLQDNIFDVVDDSGQAALDEARALELFAQYFRHLWD